MKSNDVRHAFLEYFMKNGHEAVSSSRLIPEDDPTLLFCNAGMNQFKNTFLGLEPRDYTRATTSQKCVRAGGKHNDLENVGHTARHHTFFEMLGNFSFGDYFKTDAIHFAWEFLTKELQIDKNRLYVTVFDTDDEAADIWHKKIGVPKNKIYRFGEKDNFWRMGNTGPCGPCSEIFYDFGDKVGGDPKQNVMGGEGDRFIEIWNLVFMQYFEDEKGTMTPLPKPSIDTGMGLERLCTLLQGKLNNYDTDLFQDIISKAASLSKKEYVEETSSLSAKARKEANETNAALRVIADHARSSAFLINDGVLPSNEGRGYVLRRIMRRGIRYGRKLSLDQSLMPAVVNAVIEKMKDAYPELGERSKIISQNVQDEEKRFLKALDQGTHILNEELELLKSKQQSELNGKSAFKLYDTYGFPFDLTRLMAEEKGLKVDEAGFNLSMEKAKEKARSSWKGQGLQADQAHLIQLSQEVHSKQGDTEFLGFDDLQLSSGKIISLSDGTQTVNKLIEGQSGFVIFDKSCFYAEGGGQVGDIGQIETSNGVAEALDVTKKNNIFLIQVKVTSGTLAVNEKASQAVDIKSRRATANNHSATHLLHAALKKVLGPHVQQAGSLVDPQKLRFDFTHNQPLIMDQIQQIESLVNDQINFGSFVETSIMTPSQAKEAGALALFGEKYGDKVRVVKMGEFSMELCGGTHVKHASEIGFLKIVSEGGVSSGVRRIEALTGALAKEYVLKHCYQNLQNKEVIGRTENWQDFLDGDSNEVLNWIEAQKQKQKDLEKQIQGLKSQKTNSDDFLKSAISFSKNGIEGKLVLCDVEVDDRKVLSDLSDQLRDKVGSGIIIVVGKGEKTNPVIVGVSKDLTSSFKAGDILRQIAEAMGGKGGGRPDFAQGAAPDRNQLSKAFEMAKALIH